MFEEDVKIFDKDGKEIVNDESSLNEKIKKGARIGFVLGTAAVFIAGKLSGRKQGYSDGYKQGYNQGGQDAFNYLDRIGQIASNIKNSESEKEKK